MVNARHKNDIFVCHFKIVVENCVTKLFIKIAKPHFCNFAEMRNFLFIRRNENFEKHKNVEFFAKVRTSHITRTRARTPSHLDLITLLSHSHTHFNAHHTLSRAPPNLFSYTRTQKCHVHKSHVHKSQIHEIPNSRSTVTYYLYTTTPSTSDTQNNLFSFITRLSRRLSFQL